MIRFQIFISSTIEDLKVERDSIEEELRLKEIFEAIRVEKLPAIEKTSETVCLNGVSKADAVILIIKDRYGYIPDKNNPEKLSVTHLEFREAKRLNKPVFAFLCAGVKPEPDLHGFIREVNDFNEGVLRKKWDSIENLKSEVSLALVFWIVRRTQERPFRKSSKQIRSLLKCYPELFEFPLLIKTSGIEKQSIKEWSNIFKNHLSHLCAKKMLPLPLLLNDINHPSLLSSLLVSIKQESQKSRLNISISLSDYRKIKLVKEEAPPPLKIDVAATKEGVQFIAQAALSIIFIIVDDWFRSIDQLFVTAKSRNASHTTKASLIETAAHISVSHQGKRCFDVIERMIGLPRIENSTLNAGLTSLLITEARFEHAKAWHALKNIEKMAFKLLSKALIQNPSSSGTLYNLARQSMGNSHKIALSFFNQILDVDPSYEERWYFHRDIALIHYKNRCFKKATMYYDRACHLKNYDSELFRQSGDAHYYQGNWAEALVRYEKAIEIEPIEIYFLDMKINFARDKIRAGKDKDNGFKKRYNLSHRLSRFAFRIAESGQNKFSSKLLNLANNICTLNFDAHNLLSLYANRRRDLAEAISHLEGALAVTPEDPATRLNLTVNLIFQNEGKFTNESREQMKITIFHGGPETKGQFQLRLFNTKSRNDLCKQFDDIFSVAQKEFKAWKKRRKEVLKPEVFDDRVHIELRP